MTRSPSPSSRAPARWNNALAQAPDPRDLRKRALIAAAGRSFGVKGFHNTTLDDIAQALGVTKPALYRYVKSKHEILFECHRLAVGMAEQALGDANAQAQDPLEALRLFVEGYIRRMTGELGTCVVLTEYYSMTPEHSALIQRRRRVVDSGLRQLVQQCLDAGTIEPCDPKLAVFFFMGAINNINRWFSEGGERSGDQIAHEFSVMAVKALRPREHGTRQDIPTAV